LGEEQAGLSLNRFVLGEFERIARRGRNEEIDVTLVTLDARLAGAPGTRARVEVLPPG
jgi:hypothetical protein